MKANVIETIGTLNELKSYCCPKVAGDKDWYLRCIECKGLKNCTCGKRAVELVNNQTKPANDNSWNASMKKKAREDYESVLKSGDPINYLMKTTNRSREYAMRRLAVWRAAYPDIAKKYSELTIDNRKVTRTNRLEDRIDRVFNSKDPIDYLMTNDGLSRNKARATLSRWSIEHPDLNQKYHIREYMEKSRKYSFGEKSIEPPEKTDEISVEEFLNEQEEKLAVDVIEEPKMISDKPEVKENDDTIILQAIKAKQEEILKDIQDLKNRIVFLEGQSETLNKTYYILTGKVPE